MTYVVFGDIFTAVAADVRLVAMGNDSFLELYILYLYFVCKLISFLSRQMLWHQAHGSIYPIRSYKQKTNCDLSLPRMTLKGEALDYNCTCVTESGQI